MEQLNIQDNDEIEVDVSEIVHVLLNKIWVIILVGIIVGLVAIVGTYLFVTPQYESTTKMYVLSKQDSNTLTSQDMQTSLSLTKDYAELIKSRTVTEGVITQLNLNLTHEQLLGKMTVDSATDTRILSIQFVIKILMKHVRLQMQFEVLQPIISRMSWRLMGVM